MAYAEGHQAQTERVGAPLADIETTIACQVITISSLLNLTD